MTTNPARPRLRPSLGPVGEAVDQQLRIYQKGYLDDESFAVSALARIRRGAGKLPEDVPDLWGLTGLDAIHQSPVIIHDADRRRAEVAAHIALTLWALHQQSHRQDRMHTPNGRELGEAVRRLMPPGDLDDPVRKRFVQAGTATSISTLAERLRDLVVLLRREAIALDYAVLADQLYRWQQPGGVSQTRGAWGRSFHAYRSKPKGDGDPKEPSGSTQGDESDQD